MLASAANAQDDVAMPFSAPATPDPAIAEIQQRLAEQDREIRALKAQLNRAPDLLEALPAANETREAERIEALPAVLKPGETPASSDKRLTQLEKQWDKFQDDEKKKKDQAAKSEFPSWRITGFTQLDSALYDQSPLNRETVGDAQDGTGFRRARLAVQGKVAEFTSYQLEMDFATAGRPSFFDNYIDQTNLPFFQTIRVGQYLQPFSIDAQTGFRYLPFLERSLPFLAFVPFRRVGAMSYGMSEDERNTWAYSIFRTGGFANAPLGDDRFATDIGDIGGYSFSTRMTHLVYFDPNADGRYFWQIGGAYNYSQLSANDAIGSGAAGNSFSPRPFYQARTGPEFGVLGYPEFPSPFGSAANGTPSFVDTGRYEASNFQLFGLETLYQNGPTSIQAEWIGSLVQSVVGPVFYHGASGEIMYRLTGEHREYEKRTGVLKNPIPFTDFIPLRPDGICGWGAWEIAARWSYVDLRNPDKLDGHYYSSAANAFNTTANAGNGTLYDTTVGVTWFLNKHTKLQFNWIHAMLDNTAMGRSHADLFVTRAQVDF